MTARYCAWCGAEIPAGARAWTRFCKTACRQAAWRARRKLELRAAADEPKRLAYADPPFPGQADLYRDQPSYAGEVDHAELIARLHRDYDGWALSTSERKLKHVLSLCPDGVRTTAWVKPGGRGKTRGIFNVWEPLIVWPARHDPPGVPSWFHAHAARGGGDLIGRKPIAFCRYLFRVLGARPGDELADLYPGTGIVGRAWAAVNASPTTSGDASELGAGLRLVR